MTLVLAPQPVSWLKTVVDYAQATWSGSVRVAAPWYVEAPTAFRRSAFLQRRMPALGEAVVSAPGWPALEAAAQAWAGARADRQWRARMATRALADRWAAARLHRLATNGVVIAPSLAAWRIFAAARARRLRTVLIQDYPALRALAEDLDRVAEAYPDSALARRFRPTTAMIVRQESEWELADEILPRQRWDCDVALAWGRSAAAVRGGAPGSFRTVLLAGPALARSGAHQALAAVERDPNLLLHVRAGDAIEPTALQTHPRVVVRGGLAGPEALDDMDAVIAPAWCESHAPELSWAVARGLPVWATPKAGAHLPPGSWYSLEIGEVPALDADRRGV